MRREQGEPQGAHAGQIPHGSVGRHPGAAEGLQNGGVHFTHKCAGAGPRIEILDNGHPRPRAGLDQRPPVGAVGVRKPGERGVGTTDLGGDRVPQHGGHIGEQAAEPRRRIALVAKAQVELFDSICHSAGVKLPDGVQVALGQVSRGSVRGSEIDFGHDHRRFWVSGRASLVT